MITARTLRARVENGTLVPLERLDLPEGAEVAVTIRRELDERDLEAFRRAAGAWVGLVDAKKLIRDIYASRRRVSTRRSPKM
jgi:predicted DNA-binding antitoxin AbrB/MazE fold protein